jgi:peptidoglycan/xylan/chitin deacetylase (PgdA/CDA1 family)
MPLEPAYLEYPRRRYGMDHDRYEWSILPRRPKVQWPNGARIALWVNVALEFFPLDSQGKPFKLPGGMVTPYPDLRHYSLRDYGNRVGVYRLLRLFDRLKLRVSWAVNSRVATRYPSLIRTVVERGDEIVAHGVDMDHPHYGGQPEDEERALVHECLEVLRQTSSRPVEGWISPGKSESTRTPDLLAAAGIRWLGDWINDDMPYEFRTAAGPLIAMPHGYDIDDRQSIIECRHSEAEFARQVVDQFEYLAREAVSQGGRIVSISLHPWIVGQPHRIGALEWALSAITDEAERAGLWSAAGGEIARAWAGAMSA